jgi:carboxylesterase type B
MHKFILYCELNTGLCFVQPAGIMANLSATAGIPTWRYYFNATFPNTQPAAASGVNLGAYHSSEIPIVYGTFSQVGATLQEIELSKFMRGAWARFARHPEGGPGWSKWDGKNLGVIGSNGSIAVVVIAASEVDYRCPILEPVILAE